MIGKDKDRRSHHAAGHHADRRKKSDVQGGEHFGGTASRECGLKKVIAVISAKGGAGHEV